jgi:hypothetical protein
LSTESTRVSESVSDDNLLERLQTSYANDYLETEIPLQIFRNLQVEGKGNSVEACSSVNLKNIVYSIGMNVVIKGDEGEPKWCAKIHQLFVHTVQSHRFVWMRVCYYKMSMVRGQQQIDRTTRCPIYNLLDVDENLL